MNGLPTKEEFLSNLRDFAVVGENNEELNDIIDFHRARGEEVKDISYQDTYYTLFHTNGRFSNFTEKDAVYVKKKILSYKEFKQIINEESFECNQLLLIL